MKLIFHGGAKEVGKMCIELATKNSRFMFDCGVKLGIETEYPNVPKNPGTFDAAVISHAHLDHCAGIPYMTSKGLKCPMFMTRHTKDLAKILIKDFYHVESLTQVPSYSKENMFSAFNKFQTKDYKYAFKVKEAYFQLYDAGHIPGSSIIAMEADGKRIAFTGDINTNDTRLMKGADTNIGHIDALICETTYGDREHPDRNATEKEFIANIKKVIDRGGQVVIPVFGVGRAQEILLLLHEQQWKVPIYLDGMAKEVTDLIIQQDSCKDKRMLIKARSKTIYVEGRKNREQALTSQGIFITTSGMLTGGPIIDYLKVVGQDSSSAILLTGYVVEGTNGRLLLDEGSIFIEGKKVKIKAEYKQYDFSAHSGLTDLRKLVQKFNPKTLILIHGSESSVDSFAQEQRKKGREVFVPEIGSEINI